MGHVLIVAEKPNAAEKIASAIAEGKVTTHKTGKAKYFELTRGGKTVVVAPSVGHVYGLVEAEKKGWTYPVFGTKWTEIWNSSKAADYAMPYVDNIKRLSAGADEFFVSTDFDIEGSVIGFNILRFCCNRQDAKRMKFSTLTKKDILSAFENPMPHLDFPQIEAGLARHQLDWIYGINLSRALTSALKSVRGGFNILSTGRVQGPTLAILAERELEISKFKPVPFWQITLLFEAGGKQTTAEHVGNPFWKKEGADSVMDKTRNQPAVVEKTEKKLHEQSPPAPFNLTSLQTEAHRHFGFVPSMTQQIAQSLYERALISYPRTSSEKLPASLGLREIVKKLGNQTQYAADARELLAKPELKPNEGEKSDPAHPAIFPTGEFPGRLSPPESRLYDLIVRRFFAVFGEPAVRETLTVTIDVNGEDFIARGVRTVERGWTKHYDPYSRLEQVTLPPLKEGDVVKVIRIDQLSKETQPPARYNAASLVKKLEQLGLGTKATRADIIQRLYDRNYVTGARISVTGLGMAVFNTLSENVPRIISIELTREFETKMENIQEGKNNKEQIIDDAVKILSELLLQFREKESKIGAVLLEAIRQSEVLGPCPACGKDLRIRYSSKNGRYFCGCSGYPACRTAYPLVPNAKFEVVDRICEKCRTPIVRIIRQGRRPFEMCLDPKCPTKAGWNAAPITKPQEPVETDGVEKPVY